MYKDVEESLARNRKMPYDGKFVQGLPIGLRMSNGVIVGA